MEFLQVPETPAPESVEPPDAPDCCVEEKIGNATAVHQYTVIDFIRANQSDNVISILWEIYSQKITQVSQAFL